MTLKEAQNVAFRLTNLKSDNVTIAEIKEALCRLGNFYEDYRHKIKKTDSDHPDYIDPYLKDGENQNYN